MTKLIKRDLKKKDSVEKKTVTHIDEYNGNPIFQIWLVNELNENTHPYPVISFGKDKAKLLFETH